jgi:uncharacterized protein (TIGR03000 family)
MQNGQVYDPYLQLPGTVVPGSGNAAPSTDMPAPGNQNLPTGTQPEGSTDGDTAVLNLRLPPKAVVYVNNKRTTTPGDFRSYVSRNLRPGKRYTYEVRAEVEQGGSVVSRTKVVHLTAGVNKTVDFEFAANSPMVTSVTLNVPEDAKVRLAGSETTTVGSSRYFSTSALKAGEKWDNYTVSVTVNRNGKDIVEERTVSLNAGDSLTLDFDLDRESRVAAR